MSVEGKVSHLSKLLREEQKKLMGATAAFSIAAMLLIVQGSIATETFGAKLGAMMLAASIPAGILCYVAGLKVAGADAIPEKAAKMWDDFFLTTLCLSWLGFLMLLADTSLLLAGTLVAAFAVSFFWLTRIQKGWPSADSESSNAEVEADEAV